mmetsp:Transcript_18034/g.28730  ORF Transcript_18034/g.28730 Transcript_18034/m.28730 type:complete len:219 (-) Transcript_18034:1453-2109(-)
MFKRTANWYRASVDKASTEATTSSSKNSRITFPLSEKTNKRASRTARLPLRSLVPCKACSPAPTPTGTSIFPLCPNSVPNASRFWSKSKVSCMSNSPLAPYIIYLRASLTRGESSVSSLLAIYGYALSIIANVGFPTNAIPSNTPIARIINAKNGGMRNGNSYVISARSEDSSLKLIDLAPPPANAASNTRVSAGSNGSGSYSVGINPKALKSSPILL